MIRVSLHLLLLILISCDGKVKVSGIGSQSSSSASGLTPSQLCNGVIFETIIGVAVCQSASASDEASSNNVLSGKEFWNSSGNLSTGTMTNYGVLNPSVTDTVDGYVASVTNVPLSNISRSIGTTQISLAEEKTTSGSLPVGYRLVPEVAIDDDGADASSTVVKAARPTIDCGGTGGITDRISDCSLQNGATATWDGEANGINAEKVWSLVSRINAQEVWVDTSTGLLWSDTTTSTVSWCDATGNLENLGGVDCVSNGGESYCAELDNSASGLDPALPSEDTAGSFNGNYDDIKGGMGLQSANVVTWRLPTRTDYLQAEINGIRFVLPNAVGNFWTSTLNSLDRGRAWFYDGDDGQIRNNGNRSAAGQQVRCVGHADWE